MERLLAEGAVGRTVSRMDDYRDLVSAAFAVLCAALLLVAGFLFIISRPEPTNSGPQVERPGTSGATAPLISSNARNSQL
jgi:hypothetical protein